MVSTRPLIFKSSSTCINSLVIVPRAPITIGITVTFMFFLIEQGPGTYLSFCFLSISLSGQPRQQSLQFGKFFLFSFFFLLLIISWSGRLAEIRWFVCMSKSQRSFRVSFSRTDSGFVIIIITLLIVSFSHKRQLMAFHWSLSDSNSPIVSMTLLSILASLNYDGVCTVSIHLPMSNSSSAFSKALGTILNTPTTTGITVTLMFYIFLSSLARC